MKAAKLIAVLLLAMLMLGCQTKLTRDPAFSPVEPPMPPASPQGNGAIYQAGFEKTWFENDTAKRVGDILIVTLEESTDGSSTNSSNVSKTTSTTFTNPTLLGKQPTFNLPLVGNNATLGFDLDSSHTFAGAGDQAQSNALTGTLSVMVVDVLPNGYLKVRGEKRIGMNSGNEYIRISGIVRPADIDTSNTIRSTQIADATLVYLGDGQLADASLMGWFSRFFLSPFMPF